MDVVTVREIYNYIITNTNRMIAKCYDGSNIVNMAVHILHFFQNRMLTTVRKDSLSLDQKANNSSANGLGPVKQWEMPK